jgi:predicted CopG family antitoxin
MDDDLFNRDYLFQHFSEVIIESIQKIGNDETLLKEQFTHFVDWLYKELEKLKEERRKFPDIGLN